MSRCCRTYRLASLVATSAKMLPRSIFFRFAPSLFESLASYSIEKQKAALLCYLSFLAESKGFEPSNGLSPLHDFQVLARYPRNPYKIRVFRQFSPLKKLPFRRRKGRQKGHFKHFSEMASNGAERLENIYGTVFCSAVIRIYYAEMFSLSFLLCPVIEAFTGAKETSEPFNTVSRLLASSPSKS